VKVAITGGTGFVGRHLAAELSAHGHDVVLVARGVDRRDEATRDLPRTMFVRASLSDEAGLREAFDGCDAVAHCAGINREIGRQTYRTVHVEGTRTVVAAALAGGVRRIAMLSFLRARPGCGSGYHESKWAAEEAVRSSGLDWTVLKSGVIYGRGDHMLDHLSRALHTFPVFATVGLRDRALRPVSVVDIARILESALIDGTLVRRTIAVLGPDELTLGEAVRRVASVVGRRPLIVRLPVLVHLGLAWLAEELMTIPFISIAQVRILAEGVIEPLPFGDDPPAALVPTTLFDADSIRAGLPAPGGFSRRDLRRATPIDRQV
jgi:NADH dehydrogenase